MKSNRELVEHIQMLINENAYANSSAIMSIYEELDRRGSHELVELKMAYLMGEIKPPMQDLIKEYLVENPDELKLMKVTAGAIAYGKQEVEKEILERHMSTLSAEGIKYLARTIISIAYPGKLNVFNITWEMLNKVDFNPQKSSGQFGLAFSNKANNVDKIILAVHRSLKSRLGNRIEWEDIIESFKSEASALGVDGDEIEKVTEEIIRCKSSL